MHRITAATHPTLFSISLIRQSFQGTLGSSPMRTNTASLAQVTGPKEKARPETDLALIRNLPLLLLVPQRVDNGKLRCAKRREEAGQCTQREGARQRVCE